VDASIHIKNTKKNAKNNREKSVFFLKFTEIFASHYASALIGDLSVARNFHFIYKNILTHVYVVGMILMLTARVDVRGC
jgi:hypothetical protein